MKRADLNVEEIFHADKKRGADYLELPLTRRTFFLVGAVVVVIGFIIIGRIGYLGLVKNAIYTERAGDNINKEIVIPAPRGVISDRFGTVLAENKSAFSVWIDVPKLLKDKERLPATLGELAKIIGGGVSKISRLIHNTDLERRPIVKVADDIGADAAIKLKGLKLPGVQVVDDYVRRYISPRVFSHVVGYGKKAGLEGAYNEYLSGENGKRVIYRNAVGAVLGEKQIINPRSGGRLQTTIDAEFQKYFYRRFAEGLRDLGKTAGVGLAIDPQSGAVLALMSFPSFDNNNLADYLNAPGSPFFNRAVSGEYNPGSTIKPVDALAALREKIITPEMKIFSSGRLEVPNPYDPDNPSIFLDWRPQGWVDLYSALARSSNVYFYEIGGGYNSPDVTTRGLGIEKLNKYWNIFHFGRKTNIDLPAEGDGFLPNPALKEKRTGQVWRIGDTYNVAIGQGDLLVTPIQLLSFIASVGNGGRLYQPFLVSNDTLPKIVFDYGSWKEEVKDVQKGLYDAVNKPYGTARLIGESLPIKAAGKTGSAQVANNTKTNAFFVGYEPATDPKIAILILVEDALEGSLNTVPIARDVLDWYYKNRIHHYPHD